MSKNIKVKTNHGLIIIISFILLFGAVIYLAGNTDKTYTPQVNTGIGNWEKTKNFESKDLQFSIKVPQNFQIKSSNTGVDIIHREGSIEIIRNGTQFSTLGDYINDFDNKRNIRVKLLENLNIAGYESVKRSEERVVGGLVKNPNVYYIWVDYAVYILSTSSESLVPALDQIAQSFRYTP